LYGTVTCRQFHNLTFAPRKTYSISVATSRFNAINVTTLNIIQQNKNICKYFFQGISTEILGGIMGGISVEFQLDFD